jgi:hypothetical protein
MSPLYNRRPVNSLTCKAPETTNKVKRKGDNNKPEKNNGGKYFKKR